MSAGKEGRGAVVTAPDGPRLVLRTYLAVETRAAPARAKRSRRGLAASHSGRRCQLLQLHGRAGILELLLEVCRLGLADAFLDRLGRGLDEILGLLEAQARYGPHFLDDV